MNISVAITTYDRFKQCKRAIKSVLSQNIKIKEIIVIEDNSDSGIKEWIENESFGIKYIRNNTNLRLAGSRNVAISESKGDWIAFLDDDDQWLENRLSEQVNAYNSIDESEKEKLCCIQCGNETFNKNGNSIGVYLPQNCGNLKESIMSIGAKTPSSSFLFKKSALEKVNGFSEDLISGVDHDIWMKLAVEGYNNLCLKKALVKIYQEPIETMMTNTDKRIIGISQYTLKWQPTYIEWFGEKEGIVYSKNYYSYVISGLVAQKLLIGKYKEAIKASRSIISFNESLLFSLKYILTVFTIILREKLPLNLKKIIKKLIR